MKSVVSIAGSDSSGGAGIQADIKTITAHNVFAQTVITALTAQNTLGVTDVLDIDPAFVSKQIDSVFSDIYPDAVKIGMVSSAAIVDAIADGLEKYKAKNIVVDPVMVATSGAALAAGGAIDQLSRRLFPIASVITPNIPEAEALSGMKITTPVLQEECARKLAAKYHVAALVKGGHSQNDANDVLSLEDGTIIWFEGKRVDTSNTHGTGCTLSSAIACGLANGYSIDESVKQAKEYLTGALAADLGLGKGSGPVNHMWRM